MASPPRKLATSDWTKVVRDALIVVLAAFLTWGLETFIPMLEEEKYLPAATVVLIAAILSACRRYLADTRLEGG